MSVVLAAPSATTKQVCAELKTQFSSKLLYPQDDAYGLENTDYYNLGLAELKPACIFQPRNSKDVAAAVELLNKNTDVPFAVKSGGHSPNVGHSSVKDGVLIAMSKIKFSRYIKDKKLAEFGPGGHWNELIKPLDEQGVAVVGGRLGIVGVAGLVLQGGLSFLSAQYGLAADVC